MVARSIDVIGAATTIGTALEGGSPLAGAIETTQRHHLRLRRARGLLSKTLTEEKQIKSGITLSIRIEPTIITPYQPHRRDISVVGWVDPSNIHATRGQRLHHRGGVYTKEGQMSKGITMFKLVLSISPYPPQTQAVQFVKHTSHKTNVPSKRRAVIT